MKTFLVSTLLMLTMMFMPARAALIYITPAQQQVEVGDTVWVDILVSDLAGNIVSGWDLNLFYNSAILQATDVFFDLANFSEDPDWDALYDFELNDGDVGSFLVSFLFDDELALLQTEPVRLFSVSFLALTDGVSLLNFGLDPLFQLNVVGRNGASLPLVARGACIGVGQGQCAVDVPAPATLWLFAVAVLLPLSRRLKGNVTGGQH